MTNFTTQTDIKSMTYRLIFETDNKEYFEHMQNEARKCVDHLIPVDIDELLWNDLELNPCHYSGGKLLHAGTWHPGRWYEWVDKFGNREIARMKADAFDHFWPETKIIKEENVVAFKDVERYQMDDYRGTDRITVTELTQDQAKSVFGLVDELKKKE